jgi:hypothetical protein
MVVGREDVLPNLFTTGVGIFSFEGIRQIDAAEALKQVFF